MRLHRAAAREPGTAGGDRGGHQPEKLDRPARRVYPRHRRREARIRSRRWRLPRPALVREGSRLSQLRLRRGDAALDAAALRALHARERLVDRAEAVMGDGVAVSIDLVGAQRQPDDSRSNRIIGYRAKRHTAVIEIERRAAYDVGDFWEPIAARADRTLIL